MANSPVKSKTFRIFGSVWRQIGPDVIVFDENLNLIMSLNLPKIVVGILKEQPEKKFTAKEIAISIFKSHPDECREKQERSNARVVLLNTDEALIQQIAAEISSQRLRIQQKYLEVKSTEGRPRRYYFSTMTDEAEIASKSTEPNNTTSHNVGYSEHNLYPMLSEFLWRELGIYSKRIDEKRSRNNYGSGGNRWLFPDVVGLEDLSHEWHNEIKGVVQEISDQKTKLWSFEVKKLINRSNIREAYFQTVSNSSWANFGYLVAAEIQGAEKEIRMLSGLHGIGLIKIDIDSPADSEIMLPARERIKVDWNAANRLAEENTDFLEYIKLIRQFYQTGEHRPKDWDIPKD